MKETHLAILQSCMKEVSVVPRQEQSPFFHQRELKYKHQCDFLAHFELITRGDGTVCVIPKEGLTISVLEPKSCRTLLITTENFLDPSHPNPIIAISQGDTLTFEVHQSKIKKPKVYSHVNSFYYFTNPDASWSPTPSQPYPPEPRTNPDFWCYQLTNIT